MNRTAQPEKSAAEVEAPRTLYGVFMQWWSDPSLQQRSWTKKEIAEAAWVAGVAYQSALATTPSPAKPAPERIWLSLDRSQVPTPTDLLPFAFTFKKYDDDVEYVRVAPSATGDWDREARELVEACAVSLQRPKETLFAVVRFDEIVTAIAALVRRASAGQAWRPIDSAPKNQKVIVGYFNRLGKWRTVMASYYAEGTLDCETNESGYAHEGWYEECETQETLWPTDESPTLWQPLPAAPSGGEAVGEEGKDA